MVLIWEVREEIESTVSQAVSLWIKADTFLKDLTTKVNIAKTIHEKFSEVKQVVADLENKFLELKEDLKQIILLENNTKTDEINKHMLIEKTYDMDQVDSANNIQHERNNKRKYWRKHQKHNERKIINYLMEKNLKQVQRNHFEVE